MKKWFKAFAVMGACAFMLGTMGVASADEYEGYDENGNYVYAVTDEQGNVAVAVADEDGNYAVVAEGADGQHLRGDRRVLSAETKQRPDYEVKTS